MKAIRQRKTIFAALGVLFVFIGALTFACGTSVPEIQTRTLSALSALAGGCLLVLWAREYRRLKTAQLIVENQILRICPAVIGNDAVYPSQAGDGEHIIEVFVSYFGILLDARIVKFNQDGILLKAVEIGRDFISLTYGTGKGAQTTRLFFAAIPREELEKIAERFRYETGIVPVIFH